MTNAYITRAGKRRPLPYHHRRCQRFLVHLPSCSLLPFKIFLLWYVFQMGYTFFDSLPFRRVSSCRDFSLRFTLDFAILKAASFCQQCTTIKGTRTTWFWLETTYRHPTSSPRRLDIWGGSKDHHGTRRVVSPHSSRTRSECSFSAPITQHLPQT